MTESINCIIIDDEPLAVMLIEDYAKKIARLNVLYAGNDVFEAIKILEKKNVDLIFLDIQMPEISGIELMEMFNENHNFIITSAYQEYAMDSFEYHVVDFLLKPITFKRFFQSVEKYIKWQKTFKTSSKSEHLFVKADKKHHKIAFKDIQYIEGLKEYIRIHTNEGKIMFLENMKDILEKLPNDKFIRIHRSYIISTDRIKLIEGRRIQLQNLEYIPIGETYRKLVVKWLDNNNKS